MKSNKRRTYAEIEKDEKIKDEGLKELEDEKLKLQDQILGLISEIDDLKHKESEYNANQDKLAILFDKGIVDSHWDLIKL